MKLSVILPVYNVEPYLERCIRSLQDQNLKNEEYEIIVVNDGSPDNSRQVALRLMNEFANIVLIEQENKGVSMARNAGVERARGLYVLFVDPDDYVLPLTLSPLLDRAIKARAEVAFLGYYFLDANGKKIAAVLHHEFKEKIY